MAIRFIRKFAKGFFLCFNIIACVLLCLSCLALFVGPASWAPIGFITLSIPYVASLLILFIIFWLIVKPKLALISFVTLIISFKPISVITAWHFGSGFKEKKATGTLRVVTWNVRGMYGISTNYYTQMKNRTEIAELVNGLDADIVCLQEFNNVNVNINKGQNNISLFSKAFPYHYFANDFGDKIGNYEAGTILFSKYPLISSGKINYAKDSSESLVWGDFLFKDDTVRLFTTHLQSFQFSSEDYANMNRIKEPDMQAIHASESIYSKMKKAFQARSRQADVVKKETAKSPYPSVICGDFNDVPGSYTYFTIRSKRQDAFLKKSSGIGRSFNALAPTLRIDYILPDDNFAIQQFEMIDEGLSDHHLLVADMKLKK